MAETRTELKDLGEFGLIDTLTSGIHLHTKSTLLGVGDDAALIDPGNKKVLLATDMLCEGIHFDLMYCPLKHLGYKAVISNLSDIYAMNGQPTQIVISLAVSNRFSVEAMEELYKGVYTACERYGVDLVGGDTTSSLSGLVVNVAVMGLAEKSKVVKRSGAKKGDLLVVTGDLGAAYMGLQILEREKEVFKAAPTTQPQLEGKDYLLERQLKPEARKDIIDMFEKLDVLPTSMIDISDGLASEILHLTKASELGCKLYEEKIPIDPLTHETAREFNLDPTTCALSGGEDYELLFTISQSDYDKIKGSPHMTPIGHLVEAEEGNQMVTRSGSEVPIQAQGWNGLEES